MKIVHNATLIIEIALVTIIQQAYLQSLYIWKNSLTCSFLLFGWNIYIFAEFQILLNPSENDIYYMKQKPEGTVQYVYINHLKLFYYNGIVSENQLCILCNQNVIENEYHFMLWWSKYRNLRIKHYCNVSWPNMNTFNSFMTTRKSCIILQII